ncbi:unnamed protein product [Tuber aestivum]|uniref:Tyrosinase copper-binding domain-containing protein n=1 Tax=Tuber aestivum TaxID=59557 RepID=A0A292Q0S9_9PEZI|nr:unnamed protein product [Tuber aestivum]
MQLPRLLTSLLFLSPLVVCHAVTSPDKKEVYTAGGGKCKNPLVRREWRLLPDQEKKNYIDAVKCLQTLPALTSNVVPGAITRFDDFQSIHIRLAEIIHNVGLFHHWHRYFVWFYEKALREECGYNGAQPYWDWTLDSASESAFLNSPIWCPTTGFGGNGPYINESGNPFLSIPGRTGGGCVPDGPFSNYTLHLGPRGSIAKNPQCLRRDFAPFISPLRLTKELVRLPHCEKAFDWYDFKAQAGAREAGFFLHESSFHSAPHIAVGGEAGQMGDIYASPGDPIFYLHHAGVDREWWKWQNVDPETRLKDARGPSIRFDFPFGNNFRGGNITLEHEIGLLELAPVVPLRKVMDTEGDLLCYSYAKEKAVYDPTTEKWVAEELSAEEEDWEACKN